MVVGVREYLDERGVSPFGQWLFALRDHAGAAKIAAVLDRMSRGNFGDAKTVGSGVFERRIDFGPGYRIYFGRDGDTLVILLAGGTKKRQARDVEDAKQRWDDYKRRKKIEG